MERAHVDCCLHNFEILFLSAAWRVLSFFFPRDASFVKHFEILYFAALFERAGLLFVKRRRDFLKYLQQTFGRARALNPARTYVHVRAESGGLRPIFGKLCSESALPARACLEIAF